MADNDFRAMLGRSLDKAEKNRKKARVQQSKPAVKNMRRENTRNPYAWAKFELLPEMTEEQIEQVIAEICPGTRFRLDLKKGHDGAANFAQFEMIAQMVIGFHALDRMLHLAVAQNAILTGEPNRSFLYTAWSKWDAERFARELKGKISGIQIMPSLFSAI